MKKLTQQDLENLLNDEADADAVNRKEQRKKKKKHNHIYNKESE
jgi:hypothetical protein